MFICTYLPICLYALIYQYVYGHLFTDIFILTYIPVTVCLLKCFFSVVESKRSNKHLSKEIFTLAQHIDKYSSVSLHGLIDQIILSIMEVFTNADCITLDFFILHTVALRIKLRLLLIYQSQYVYENGLSGH